MEFGAVLQAAQTKNNATNGGRFYKASFDPPKKEVRNKSQLSANIQKFLAKKEQEEREKAEEAKRKREQLIAMRDPKMNNKIKKMLKVIKSANKSVLDDAIDHVNTAVTLDGPDQPDEDDYGYVSQEASALYSKMMEKYKNIPDEKKFSDAKKVVNSDLASTKDRVRAAILKHKEEEAMPHRRKRRSNAAENDDFDDGFNEERTEKKEEKPKIRKPAPPPLDFNSLLKIAEKKQFEPIVIEPKKPEIEEPERLMTKRQKREHEQLMIRKENQERREKARLEKLSNTETGTPKNISTSNMRIPKLNEKSSKISNLPKNSNVEERKKLDNKESYSNTSREQYDPKKPTMKAIRDDLPKNIKSMPSSSTPKSKPDSVIKKTTDGFHKNKIKSESSHSTDIPRKVGSSGVVRPDHSRPVNKEHKIATARDSTNDRLKSNSINDGKRPPQIINNKTNSLQLKSGQDRMQTERKFSNPSSNSPLSKATTANPNIKNATPRVLEKGTSVSSVKQKDSRLPTNGESKKVRQVPPADAQKTRQFPPSDVQKTRQFPPTDVQKTRQFPPADVQKTRQFPPADVRGARQFPPSDMAAKKKMHAPKRRILDDDSEYDSEMDDFIDDGPDEKNDYSKYIKEIFGYDKSRYRGLDEDDANMESNFSQVMKEEIRSAKIGIMEDLEDIQKEKMEKKRKMMMLAKRRKIQD